MCTKSCFIDSHLGLIFIEINSKYVGSEYKEYNAVIKMHWNEYMF